MRATLSNLGSAIKTTIVGPSGGAPSAAEIEDFNVNVTVKGTTYILASDPAQGATVVCVQEGVVHLTPLNPSLAPFDLTAGNQVRITADAVGPITPGCTLPTDLTVLQPNTNAARMTLQAAQRGVVVNDLVRLPVWLVKGENLANLNVDVVFDPSVVRVEGDIVKGNLLDNALFSANANDEGAVRVGLAVREGDISGTGTILNLPFRAVGQPGDRTPILLTITTSNDPQGGELTLDRIAGEIVIVNPDGTLPPNVTGGGSGSGAGAGGSGGGGGGSGAGSSGAGAGGGLIRGDCDGSGVLTEIDALCALDMSVQRRPSQPLMDLDNSGDVTSRDAALILQQVVGQ
jgi:hypothetical protein